MVKKQINQNDIYNLELLNTIENKYVFNNIPINRILRNKSKNLKVSDSDKQKKLEDLRGEINSIENCNLKINDTKLVFGSGNINSKLMIIGGTPSESDNKIGSPFNGEEGLLLEKMLNAINIKKKNIYLSNAINFHIPNDRKPNSEEVNRYSIFIQKHVSIINPKIIILMGSTAMEALTGLNQKISLERGKWKDIIIKNTNYIALITFSPSYLLRLPKNKIYSWDDLKKIKQKINNLNLTI
jgi:uracil-DNA glycosylase